MKKKRKKHLIVIDLVVLVLINLITLSCVSASETHDKVIRVGYAIAVGYQEGGDGEYKTGYGYEYLQSIAKINGWKYEYVYGSFNELFEKLQNGEIDLMGHLAYTEDNERSISYGSYEEGEETLFLYVNKKNNLIQSCDYSSINGKKIGICAGYTSKGQLSEWLTENNLECSIIDYDSGEDCETALNSGEIDAVIAGEIPIKESTADWEAILKFDEVSFYFGVNKNRPDILDELNYAQSQIIDDNIFYNENINERSSETFLKDKLLLNEKEEAWLTDNGRKIKFGYLKGFPPLCYQDKNGDSRGVASDILYNLKQKYPDENIEIETIAYDDYYTMFNALESGTISVAWPFFEDYWYAEQEGYFITDCVVDTSMMLVYDGVFTDDTVAKIGVINKGILPKIYANIYYPQSEIYEFDSYESAIDAVANNKVSSVLYVSTTYNVDIRNNKTLQRLNAAVLSDAFGISCAVLSENGALCTILDKGIKMYGQAEINRSLIVNSSVDNDITLKAYFEQHPYMVAIVIAIVLILITGVLLLILYREMSIRIKVSQEERKIYERLSNTDPLTGLYNRKKVFSKCRELLNEHPDDTFVMLHVDMNHFRLYNSFFGDQAGDQLLCDIANLFRDIDKDYDYWAYGRIEADVFCLFFPYNHNKFKKHLEEATDFLKKYRSDFLIEAILGMYFVTDRQMPIEAMFTRATLAAKEAKKNPKLQYGMMVYDEKLELELNDNQQVINDMQTAIAQEQFKVYLQPKYSLKTKRLAGAEALVRWIHPTKGVVSPGKFIPVFEANGFINTLDKYMWEHVCQLLSNWKKEGKPLFPISVNVSRHSMFNTDTVNFLKELITKYDIEPEYLELELTESAYIADPEEMKLQMFALRDAGFKILLDDFGSGYSGLNTLRELPVDVLKLDMKFLSVDSNDVRSEIILSSIVHMSELLKLPVIAEGVELQEQSDFLEKIGCEFVQGYLFSRPIPIDEYEKILISK